MLERSIEGKRVLVESPGLADIAGFGAFLYHGNFFAMICVIVYSYYSYL